MKKYMMMAALLLLAGGVQAYGQSFTEMISNSGVKEVVESVADQLDVIPRNIEGTWEFSGSAVKFTGGNVLMNAASELAVGKVEAQLDEYLQTVGIGKGFFLYVFDEDGGFSTIFNQAKFPGEYTYSKEDKTLELDYGMNEKLKGISLKTNVTIGSRRLQLLFNADRLLDFISKISASAADSNLAALASLLENYDGMQIGFELTRVE